MEAAARLVYAYQYDLQNNELIGHYFQKRDALDPYKVPDEILQNHWRLKPNYSASATEIDRQKHAMGKGLNFGGTDIGITNTRYRLNINGAGFRGDEIQEEENGRRVLFLGDSVTFGLIERNYPELLEAKLRAAGHKIQIINGGVEGYTARNHLLEIDRYIAVEPDVVMIYLGWNSLYSTMAWLSPAESKLRILWLLRNASKAVQQFFLGAKTLAFQQYQKRGTPDRSDPTLEYIEGFWPPNLDLILELTKKFRTAGIKVFWITQASILSTKHKNSEGALAKGHLPQFSNNPLVIAKLNERYNALLRAYAFENGAQVVDAETWALANLKPPEDYFIDTVHLNSRGLQSLSEFLADEVAKRIYGENQ